MGFGAFIFAFFYLKSLNSHGPVVPGRLPRAAALGGCAGHRPDRGQRDRADGRAAADQGRPQGRLAERGGRGARPGRGGPWACKIGQLLKLPFLPRRLRLRQRLHRVLAGLHRDRARGPDLGWRSWSCAAGRSEISLVEQPPTFAEAFAVAAVPGRPERLHHLVELPGRRGDPRLGACSTCCTSPAGRVGEDTQMIDGQEAVMPGLAVIAAVTPDNTPHELTPGRSPCPSPCFAVVAVALYLAVQSAGTSGSRRGGSALPARLWRRPTRDAARAAAVRRGPGPWPPAAGAPESHLEPGGHIYATPDAAEPAAEASPADAGAADAGAADAGAADAGAADAGAGETGAGPPDGDSPAPSDARRAASDTSGAGHPGPALAVGGPGPGGGQPGICCGRCSCSPSRGSSSCCWSPPCRPCCWPGATCRP